VFPLDGLTGVDDFDENGLLTSLTVLLRQEVPSRGNPDRLRLKPDAADKNAGSDCGAIVNLVFWPMVTLTSCRLFSIK
jgi:hypothetical protein